MGTVIVLSEREPETSGSHAELIARFSRHCQALEFSTGRKRAWHVLAARGLYRLLADIECDGGPAAPMGMPHVLCISDAEACAMVPACEAAKELEGDNDAET